MSSPFSSFEQTNTSFDPLNPLPPSAAQRPIVEVQPNGIDDAPILRMAPNSDLHQKMLNHLLRRIDASERAMSAFYHRWTTNEMRTQAYINLPDHEQALQDMNDAGKPPKITSITVPYMFATINTIVTYLIHTFAGVKPYFQVGASKAESEQSAQNMELYLQYNADHVRMVKRLFQYFYDGILYGVGVLRTQWTNTFQTRTVKRQVPVFSDLGLAIPGASREETEKIDRLVFEGTDVDNVDPFTFLPDYRVPMTEVSRKGEFVFWRSYEGRHTLRKAEADNKLFWIDHIPQHRERPTFEGNSMRDLISGGDPSPGNHLEKHASVSLDRYVELNQGTIEIIPSDFGLSPSNVPEKWLFTIANRAQIVQAEPFEADHDMHPVAVIEPYTMGYGFGQAGLSDYLSPIQDAISWFINSHVYNVRTALNNMFVADPQAINVQDLMDPQPGKIIRLKPGAIGRDLNAVIRQLNVTDVTQKHIGDAQTFLKIADNLSAAPENIRGITQPGGAKTATEVRTAGQAATSRLASLAKLISSQGITDLTEIMSMNAMQNLSQEFYVRVTGVEGIKAPITLGPSDIVGDYTYPIHDGTLPMDKIAMLNVWRELFSVVSQDPQFRQQYNLGAIFEWMATLSGVKSLTKFKVTPEQQIAQQQQAGNMVPVNQFQQAQGGGALV